jgi:hypothetical protein
MPRWSRLILRLTESRNGELNKVERSATAFVDAIDRCVLKPLRMLFLLALVVLLLRLFLVDNDFECWLKGANYMAGRGVVCPATYWWDGLMPQQ